MSLDSLVKKNVVIVERPGYVSILPFLLPISKIDEVCREKISSRMASTLNLMSREGLSTTIEFPNVTTPFENSVLAHVKINGEDNTLSFLTKMIEHILNDMKLIFDIPRIMTASPFHVPSKRSIENVKDWLTQEEERIAKMVTLADMGEMDSTIEQLDKLCEMARGIPNFWDDYGDSDSFICNCLRKKKTALLNLLLDKGLLPVDAKIRAITSETVYTSAEKKEEMISLLGKMMTMTEKTYDYDMFAERCMDLLISAGAAGDQSETSPITLACLNRKGEHIEYMIQKGVYVDDKILKNIDNSLSQHNRDHVRRIIREREAHDLETSSSIGKEKLKKRL